MTDTIKLIGGDRAGLELEMKHDFRHGDIIEVHPKPEPLGPVGPAGAEACDQVVDILLYKINEFRSCNPDRIIKFAAPQDWTGYDIQAELWRVYSHWHGRNEE